MFLPPSRAHDVQSNWCSFCSTCVSALCNFSFCKVFHSTLSVYHVCDSHSVISKSLQSLWTVTCQAPLFLGFFRQEYWSGLPFPLPGDLPDPGIKLGSPALQADSSPLSHQGSPQLCLTKPCISYSITLIHLILRKFWKDMIHGSEREEKEVLDGA